MEEKVSRRGYGTLVLMAALLPVLYVLSIGPAVFVVSRLEGTTWYHPVGQIYLTVYYPLIPLYESFPTVKAILDWYLEFFVA